MENLSIIIQGAIHPNQANLVRKLRHAFPKSEIIISTWSYDKALADLVDNYVTPEDPGPFSITKNGQTIRQENVNRQIISTQAGLTVAKREWAMKWRSDFDVDAILLAVMLNKYSSIIPNDGILSLAYQTANPYAKPYLIGHISDWMYFGKTEFLKKIITSVAIPSIPEYQEIPPDRDESYSFQFSTFTCEQFMLKDGLEKIYGINIVDHPSDKDVLIYLRLIGKKIFILDPAKIDMHTFKIYDNYIYLNKKYINFYIWYVLNTIGSFSCYIGSKYPIALLIVWLKTKSNIYKLMRYLMQKIN